MQREVIKVKEGEEVEFIIGKEKLTAKVIDDEIRIHCDGTLHVIPWATNLVRLKIEAND